MDTEPLDPSRDHSALNRHLRQQTINDMPTIMNNMRSALDSVGRHPQPRNDREMKVCDTNLHAVVDCGQALWNLLKEHINNLNDWSNDLSTQERDLNDRQGRLTQEAEEIDRQRKANEDKERDLDKKTRQLNKREQQLVNQKDASNQAVASDNATDLQEMRTLVDEMSKTIKANTDNQTVNSTMLQELTDLLPTFRGAVEDNQRKRPASSAFDDVVTNSPLKRMQIGDFSSHNYGRRTGPANAFVGTYDRGLLSPEATSGQSEHTDSQPTEDDTGGPDGSRYNDTPRTRSRIEGTPVQPASNNSRSSTSTPTARNDQLRSQIPLQGAEKLSATAGSACTLDNYRPADLDKAVESLKGSMQVSLDDVLRSMDACQPGGTTCRAIDLPATIKEAITSCLEPFAGRSGQTLLQRAPRKMSCLRAKLAHTTTEIEPCEQGERRPCSYCAGRGVCCLQATGKQRPIIIPYALGRINAPDWEDYRFFVHKDRATRS